MRLQIDDINKTLTFEAESLPINFLNTYLEKFALIYPDIYEWKVDTTSSFDKVEKPPKRKVPTKPQEPDFDFTNNTLPKDEQE